MKLSSLAARLVAAGALALSGAAILPSTAHADVPSAGTQLAIDATALGVVVLLVAVIVLVAFVILRWIWRLSHRGAAPAPGESAVPSGKPSDDSGGGNL